MSRVIRHEVPIEFRGRRHLALYVRDGRFAIEAGIVSAGEGANLDAEAYSEFRRIVLERVAQIERGEG